MLIDSFNLIVPDNIVFVYKEKAAEVVKTPAAVYIDVDA